MEVEAAGEDVGAREAHEGQAGAVGAAADGLDSGLDPGHLHGLDGRVDDVHVRLHHLAHIIILVFHLEPDRARAVLGVDEFGGLGHHLLAGLELGAVVVADDVGDVGFLDGSLEGNQVEEALVALGVLRAGERRQQAVELRRDVDGVAHLALGVAGVDVAALDVELGGGGVEVLELELADFAAVHRVTEVGAESPDVEGIDAAADLLVAGKGDGDGAVLELGMVDDILDGVHDLGDAGLVIGAEEGRAVGGDQRLADIVEQLRELLRLELEAGNALEVDGLAVILPDNLRLDVLAGGVGSGVDMGHEADGGGVFSVVAGDLGVDIAVLLRLGGDAEGAELVREHVQQVPLLGRGRLGGGFFIGLRVDGDVAQEAVEDFFHI